MKNSPGVIIKTKFKESGKTKTSFNKYLNYLDRAETKDSVNDFEKYQDYMSNETKSTGLFTKHKDGLDEKEKNRFKEEFKDAQDRGSILWQDVISFDNKWLKENGILKDNFIDTKKIQEATRVAMNDVLKKEGMADSALWTAAIHFNTDNIHVHVATVQTKDFKERGKRKQSSITSMKSKVVNSIMDRSKENEKLNVFIREKVISKKQSDSLTSIKNRVVNRDMAKQFKKIHSMLPEDKRMWNYNMNGIKEVRPEIDKLTTMYLEKHFKEEFKDFKKNLEKEVQVHKRNYGNSAKSERYRETKMQDLYTRMGNTILKEAKEYDKTIKDVARKNSRKPNKLMASRDLNKAVYMMNRYVKDDLTNMKNQRAFEELEREKEFER